MRLRCSRGYTAQGVNRGALPISQFDSVRFDRRSYSSTTRRRKTNAEYLATSRISFQPKQKKGREKALIQ